jgi:hypothetical protein
MAQCSLLMAGNGFRLAVCCNEWANERGQYRLLKLGG